GALQTPPPREAIDLAASAHSRVEWPLRFLSDVARAKGGMRPDPASYEPAMRRALAAFCEGARPDDVLSVMAAIRDFAAGRVREARATLDALLAGAEARGLSVPSVTYRYEEKTATKVLSVTLGVSTGAGLLDGASSFALGFGVRSGGKPEGMLHVALEP